MCVCVCVCSYVFLWVLLPEIKRLITIHCAAAYVCERWLIIMLINVCTDGGRVCVWLGIYLKHSLCIAACAKQFAAYMYLSYIL